MPSTATKAARMTKKDMEKFRRPLEEKKAMLSAEIAKTRSAEVETTEEATQDIADGKFDTSLDIRIDRSFIKNMGEHGENQQIVRMILLLAHDLNIAVIAEGVETAEQLSQIKEMHGEFVQGYLYSRPVAADQAPACLQERPVR